MNPIPAAQLLIDARDTAYARPNYHRVAAASLDAIAPAGSR